MKNIILLIIAIVGLSACGSNKMIVIKDKPNYYQFENNRITEIGKTNNKVGDTLEIGSYLKKDSGYISIKLNNAKYYLKENDLEDLDIYPYRDYKNIIEIPKDKDKEFWNRAYTAITKISNQSPNISNDNQIALTNPYNTSVYSFRINKIIKDDKIIYEISCKHNVTNSRENMVNELKVSKFIQTGEM